MKRLLQATALVIGALMLNTSSAIAQSNNSKNKNKSPMTLEQTKLSSVGEWKSITTEVRPSAQKGKDGTIQAFYLKREFKFEANGKFQLAVTTFADPGATIALSRMDIKGTTIWQGPHPIAEGAQKVDFVADEVYTVTPLAQGFADLLNKVTSGYEKWEVNKGQDILKKAFPPFGLSEGQVFKEYDLIYVFNDLMFWGARHIDGRGFDTEQNRPTNLQIPLTRK